MNKWLLDLIIDWVLIFVSFYLIYINWWFFPLSILIIGNRQHAIGILGHDAAHGLAFKNKNINNILGKYFALYPLCIPWGGYRRFHFLHHKTVGQSDDPELIHKNLFKQWDGKFSTKRIIKHLLSDLFGGAIPHVFMALYLMRPVSVKDALKMATVPIGVHTILFFLGVYWISLIWILCTFTTFWIFFRLRIWTEHVGDETTKRIKPHWIYRILFLPHNTWCHWEHHDNPGIPYYLLPKYRESIKTPQIQNKIFQ